MIRFCFHQHDTGICTGRGGMASIVKEGNIWRAYVHKKGIRTSARFPARPVANDWGMKMDVLFADIKKRIFRIIPRGTGEEDRLFPNAGRKARSGSGSDIVFRPVCLDCDPIGQAGKTGCPNGRQTNEALDRSSLSCFFHRLIHSLSWITFLSREGDFHGEKNGHECLLTDRAGCFTGGKRVHIK